MVTKLWKVITKNWKVTANFLNTLYCNGAPYLSLVKDWFMLHVTKKVQSRFGNLKFFKQKIDPYEIKILFTF